MNLTVAIESAEYQFKQILEEFFISVYDENSLSSHGIDHHRRVWSYAKELLSLFADRHPYNIAKLPSKLIIAGYLHDLGMSIDPGIRHGHHSRDLCIQFLNKNHLSESDFQDVLAAIGNHDRKDYSADTSVSDLLTILSVADDLDAFGFTGIFRYSEIYLTRKINPAEIGNLIKVNASGRFDNFVKTFGFADLLVQKHKKRFDILDDFFSKYNEQLPFYQFGTPNPSGHCGVIEIFLLLMKNNLQLSDFYIEREKFSNERVILWFFEELQKEL